MALSSLLAACSGNPPANLGVQEGGTLAPCPNSPNCVSSFAPKDDKTHYMAPLQVHPEGWSALQRILETAPRVTITDRSENYLRAEAKTAIFRFVDDVEFLYWPDEQLIHFRSASRLGYSDLGKNRSRLEEWKAQLREQGMLVNP